MPVLLTCSSLSLSRWIDGLDAPGPPRSPAGARRGLLSATATLLLALPVLVGSSCDSRADPGHHEQIERIDGLLSEHPADIPLLIQKAERMRIAGDFGAARRCLSDAERVSPGDPLISLSRARLCLDQDSIDAALKDANHAVASMPEEPATWLVRATALARHGEVARAAADLDRAIALQAIPRPEHFLERARLRVALGDDAGALAGLDDAVATLGPLVSLEREAIAIEMQRGRADAALDRFDRLAAQYQRTEVVALERGDLLFQAGRMPEALAEWTAALAAMESRSVPGPRASGVAAGLRARLARLAAELGAQP